MSKKRSSSEFAQIMSPGTIAIICGIGAMSVLFQQPMLACLVGTLGIVMGGIILKTDVEKLDKINATIGIALSLIPIISTIVVLVKK